MAYSGFKLRSIAGAALVAMGAGSAHASLILLSPQDFQGTGLGAVNTILTLSSPGSTGFESGGVAFGDVVTGDAKTGDSQTQTRTLGELGVTSASDLRVVFNALEPGNSQNGITLDNLVLNIYDPDGNVLFTSGAFTPVTFANTLTGAGNSGFVFGLDPTQQAQAAAAFSGSFANNVVGLSAAAGCREDSPSTCMTATGGFETFFVASGGTVPVVPEPGTYAMILAGLGVVGFMASKRRRRR